LLSLAVLQAFLLEPPQQHIETILAEERFVPEGAGWNTPMSCLVMVDLVLFDHRFQTCFFSDDTSSAYSMPAPISSANAPSRVRR
jgi:hypothetical protein